jgi:hypothetical protein
MVSGMASAAVMAVGIAVVMVVVVVLMLGVAMGAASQAHEYRSEAPKFDPRPQLLKRVRSGRTIEM